MSEKKYKIQDFVSITPSELLPKVKNLKTDGYRLGQICATKISEGIQVLYSFDKDHILLNLRMTIQGDEEIQSITAEYWPAFIYENEMHDLFGIKIMNNALDYGGRFFKVSEPTPWNPNN